MLDILQEKARKEKITNIEVVLSEESSIPLPDNSVDVLLMANVFHELEDRNSILKEAKRILSGGGKLVIVDWKKIEMDFGPPIEERLAAEEVILVCKDNGFDLHEQSEAVPYNYLLVFTKEKKRPEPADKYFHGERKHYESIDDLIKKTLEDRKKRRSQQTGR